MKPSRETEALFTALRDSAKLEAVNAIENLIEHAPYRALCRINALAVAAEHKLDEEEVIAAFLHAAQLGIFDLSWNILCPGCGGVLGSGTTLKTVNQAIIAALFARPLMSRRSTRWLRSLLPSAHE